MRRFAASSIPLTASVGAGIGSGHALTGAPNCPVFPKSTAAGASGASPTVTVKGSDFEVVDTSKLPR